MKYKVQDGFPYYFALVKDNDCLELFSSQSTFVFLDSISEEKADYRYQSDKWSIKEVIGHLTDHERIKMSRAFFLSRKIFVDLWGYDQDTLVENSRFEQLSLNQLIADYINVRKATVSFIEGLSEDQLQIKGTAKEHEISLEDFLMSIIGHEKHHIEILKERYY